ncbi:MAG: cytochrome P450 [Alphaproteobacteria bacterium]|nr:MAG: cytochrome P450 [Alphaproteobacteria bacterium]
MKLQELELPYLPMEDAEFASNPYPFLDEARRQHPWIAKGAFGYVVHQYKAIQDLLRLDGPMQSDYDGIVEIMGARNTPWGDWTERHLLSAQGDRHQRMRAALAPKFTPRQANQHRELMRQVISELLDEWAPREAFDFEEFASYFPITVLCTLIGAGPEIIPSLRDSLEALGLSASMQREHLPALQKAFVQMDCFVQQLVDDRRAGKRLRAEPDMLDDLIEAVTTGGLDERELYDLLVFLFVAGFDTSKNMLTLIMDQMIDHPDKYRRCADEFDYCRRVMEETLRFCSPATIPRVTTAEVTYRDVEIPAGTNLYFPVSVAGRDPSAVVEADAFEPDRDKRSHMAFGMGMHICLGQFIARAQIQEGLHLIAQRLKEPRRAGPSNWRPFYGVWGMRGLPIAFTAA